MRKKKERISGKKSSKTRVLSKSTISENFLGETERRTAAYSDVREDSSTRSTTKIPDRGRLRKNSTEIKSKMNGLEISVVIPVFNEEENIDALCRRLLNTMDATKKKYEVIFVDDGSSDKTSLKLKDWFKKRSDVLKIIFFNGNYGQYVAILAGFEHVCGDVIVTLDADLQNLPEEIPNLLDKIEEGYDLVGGYRVKRQDHWFRRYASRLINITRARLTKIETRDHGCMLRAYKRIIIDEVVKTKETSTFITALAQKFAGNPIDIPVTHEERRAGGSKYNLYKLIRITFDLMTGFSLAPLHVFTMVGMLISALSGMYFLVELFKKLVCNHHGYGLRFAFVFLLLSVIILGIGLLGEYLGRAYFAVCGHPRFVVREILEKNNKGESQ